MDTQDLWVDFIKLHTHLSVQDLEDIGKLIDCCYLLGRADGLETGAQALTVVTDILFSDSG